MNDLGTWYASRGIWGAIVTVASGIAGLVGFVVAPEAQAELVTLGVSGGAVIGGAVAWYGRYFAKTKIG